MPSNGEQAAGSVVTPGGVRRGPKLKEQPPVPTLSFSLGKEVGRVEGLSVGHRRGQGIVRDGGVCKWWATSDNSIPEHLCSLV